MTGRVIIIWFFGVLLVACATPSEVVATAQARPMTLAPVSRDYPSGTEITYEMGTIVVPENREKPGSRDISLKFHRFSGNADAPPIYVLRGGPGFRGLEYDLERDGYYGFYLEPYREAAEIVVIEHRGFGVDNALPCAEQPVAELADVDTAAERRARYRAAAFECRDAYTEKGVDLSGYTVMQMVHDVIDVADALGHDEFQVMGASFGSHWGMAVARTYPSRVVRVTLSALEGPDHTFDMPLEKEASLRRLGAKAAGAPGLADVTTAGGIVDQFAALIARANREPVVVESTDPWTDAPVTLTLSGDDLKQVTQGFSRGTTWGFLFPRWAEDMRIMLGGDLSGAARRIQYVWRRPAVDNAAWISLECASGASAARRELLAAQTATALVGNHELFGPDICADWPADLGASYRANFESNVPALLMHGTFDTSAPYANAASVRSYFSDHHFVEIRGGSHGANIEAIEQELGFQAALIRWLQTGSAEGLPTVIELAPIEWQ
ncbi:MAG: alpha/beta hydrolase [Pseudomonadota bacterium]